MIEKKTRTIAGSITLSLLFLTICGIVKYQHERHTIQREILRTIQDINNKDITIRAPKQAVTEPSTKTKTVPFPTEQVIYRAPKSTIPKP